MLIVPLLLLAWATICDLRSREIPDAISGLVAVWAIGARITGFIDVPWLHMAAGCLLGLGLGLILFRLGGLGGGDVKMIAALGMAVGPALLLEALFFMALAGVLLALVAALRSQREFAYMPAIAAGFLSMALLTEGALRWP